MRINKGMIESEEEPLLKKLLESGSYRWGYSLRYLRPRGFSTAEVWTPDRVETGYGGVNPYTYRGGDEVVVRNPPKKAMLIRRLVPSLLKLGGYDHWLIRNYLWGKAIDYIKDALPNPSPPKHKKTFHPPIEISTDALIVGGGLAGLNAAQALAEYGVRPTIIDMDWKIGGRRVLYNPENTSGLEPKDTISRLEEKGVKILRYTIFQGFHEDAVYGYNWREDRLVIFKYKALILATGFYENPPLIENIDLPGAVSAGSLLKILKWFGVRNIKRVFLFGLERWLDPLRENMSRLGIEYDELSFHTLDPKKDKHQYRLRLIGRERVEKVYVSIDGDEETIDADLFVYAYEVTANNWASLQTGLTHVYVYGLGGYIPWHDIEGRTERDNIFIAGACGGVYTEEYDIYSGYVAGLSAAEYLGKDVTGDKKKYVMEIRRMLDKDIEFDKMMGSVYRRESVIPAKTRRFYIDGEDVIICPCTDVSLEDLNHAIERVRYVDLDMIKRYSGLSTGRCQGKLCLSNTLKYLHESHGGVIRTIHHRIRPPYTPHPIGIFKVGGYEETQI